MLVGQEVHRKLLKKRKNMKKEKGKKKD